MNPHRMCWRVPYNQPGNSSATTSCSPVSPSLAMPPLRHAVAGCARYVSRCTMAGECTPHRSGNRVLAIALRCVPLPEPALYGRAYRVATWLGPRGGLARSAMAHTGPGV